MAKRAMRVTLRDNVATMVETAVAGEAVVVTTGRETSAVVAREEIPCNFKIALAHIPRGEAVVKYGEVIGEASADIPPGALVHVHNLVGRRGRGDLARRDV
ncbi:MAG: UxaA family hydrolase [Chloroflexi bacterium]|nr:UxaA family hydrolase [Chloroflexota bacterium]